MAFRLKGRLDEDVLERLKSLKNKRLLLKPITPIAQN